jgi:hypothetical protein
MKMLYKRHGCTRTRIILPIVTQIPLFILVSLVLRGMCGWTGWFDIGMGVPLEPLFKTEGFGAILDLTRPDGTFIFPVMIGLLSVTNIEVPFLLRAQLILLANCCSEIRYIAVGTTPCFTDTKRNASFATHVFGIDDSSGNASTGCNPLA